MMRIMTDSPLASTDYRLVLRAYDALAQDYGRLLPDTRAETPLDLAMVDTFAQSVATSGGARVLDAGCGTGRMSRYLSERGCSVTGLDLSPAMVAVALRDSPGLSCVVGSLLDLPYPDNQFDGVLMWYSTIHTPPAGQARIFAEAARVLRPGGHALVGFQSGVGSRDLSAHYRERGHEVDLERHRYLADDVSRWMADAGLCEVARLVRRSAQTHERDDQAVLLATIS